MCIRDRREGEGEKKTYLYYTSLEFTWPGGSRKSITRLLAYRRANRRRWKKSEKETLKTKSEKGKQAWLTKNGKNQENIIKWKLFVSSVRCLYFHPALPLAPLIYAVHIPAFYTRFVHSFSPVNPALAAARLVPAKRAFIFHSSKLFFEHAKNLMLRLQARTEWNEKFCIFLYKLWINTHTHTDALRLCM